MLRTRLILSLVPFIAILLAVGISAIGLFSRLSHRVELTVQQNQRSSTAAELMNVAMSRMEAGLLLALYGDRSLGTNYFYENSVIFEQNLNAEIKLAPLFKDERILKDLQDNYQGFLKAGQNLLSLDQKRDQTRVHEQEVIPRSMAINLTLEQIRQNSQKNIMATSRDIQKIKENITRLMIAGLAGALVMFLAASIYLRRSMLKPIQALTRATRQIGEGNLDEMVPILSHDELGELANSFNSMAAQLKVYRQSTTEQIVRLHRTMESALASFPDPIFILDRRGHIELQNPAAQNFGGRLGVTDTLPTKLMEAANQVLKTGVDFMPHSFKEVLSLRVDGAEVSFLPRILNMRGDQNQSVGVAVVLQDVTRFRLLDDAKTNLVAAASHEMKTPLTSVRMVLHMLLEKTLGPLNPRQDDLLHTARNDAERLLRILDDFLDLARLEAEKSSLNKRRIAPVDLVQDILNESRKRAGDKGLTLASSVDPQLPGVWVDRERIEHVFQNILSNAIKHSPRGSEILVRATRKGDKVRFSVRDQGPGIPPEYHSRIFDRLFRVPGQPKTGAGLGLFIAREIVAAHDGTIGVESQPGKGSEFFVELKGDDEDLPGGTLTA